MNTQTKKNRDRQVATFLNDEEVAALDAKAQAEGLSRAIIIRMALKPIFEGART